MLAQYYPQPTTPPAPITAKLPTQERFIQAIFTGPKHQAGRTRLPLDTAAITVRWSSGEAPSVIARDLGVSIDTLYRRMQALGVTRPRSEPLAEKAETLRTMAAQGLSQTAMARRLGVQPAAVSRALSKLGITGWQKGRPKAARVNG